MSVAGAIIVPHSPDILPDAGRGQEHEMRKTADACRAAAQRVRAWEPEVLIVTSPHAAMHSDYSHMSSGRHASGDLSSFGTPQIKLETEYDNILCKEVIKWARAENIQAGSLGGNGPALDHGTLVPLYFLKEAGVNCPILRIGLSELSPLEHYRFGKCIAKAVEMLGRRAVFVASGDLSHKLKGAGPYGFAPPGAGV